MEEITEIKKMKKGKKMMMVMKKKYFFLCPKWSNNGVKKDCTTEIVSLKS